MEEDRHTLSQELFDVGDGHQLYVHNWGALESDKKIIYLHGGPGSGVKNSAKTLFDPTQHQVLFFDQRGCGKSQPYGSLDSNTTDELVDDINSLANRYDYDDFELVGGSWGSCLSLVYAIRNANRVKHMVLGGIFMGTQAEIDYVGMGEVRRHFPEVWASYVKSVPSDYSEDPRSYHYPRILGDVEHEMRESVFAYMGLEGSLGMVDDRQSSNDINTFDPTPIVVETHYIANQCFLPDGYILDNASSLTMPIDLVQGRYDMVCPPEAAFRLSEAAPRARLHMTVGGHAMQDRPNWDVAKAIIASTR